MTFKVYIPARYASSRLPGKPLLEVGGKPLIQHVYENAVASGAQEVIIATDDERIAEAARRFRARTVMTRSSHISGTDRIAEAAAICEEPDDKVIVNVQGDEPQLPPAVIRQVAETMLTTDTVDIATVCEVLDDANAINDPNIVKVVRTTTKRALYFSRAPIPFSREASTAPIYRRHVGIYAYRVGFLKDFVGTAPSKLEQTECLEQLRALSNNATIIVGDAVAECGIGIDTLDDYKKLLAGWESKV